MALNLFSKFLTKLFFASWFVEGSNWSDLMKQIYSRLAYVMDPVHSYQPLWIIKSSFKKDIIWLYSLIQLTIKHQFSIVHPWKMPNGLCEKLKNTGVNLMNTKMDKTICVDRKLINEVEWKLLTTRYKSDSGLWVISNQFLF